MTTPLLVVREIIARIAQNGPPRFYAGDWPGDTARRILGALSDAGFEVVERANGPEPSLDAAIRAACLPNMRKQLNGEDITAGDIAAEQAGMEAIRGDAAP